jgi:hypothetical protein
VAFVSFAVEKQGNDLQKARRSERRFASEGHFLLRLRVDEAECGGVQEESSRAAVCCNIRADRLH